MPVQLNDDQTVTVPLVNHEPVTLREPSLGEIAELRKIAKEADKTLGEIERLDSSATEDQIKALGEAIDTRVDRMFDGESSPHGQALVMFIKKLGVGAGDDVTIDNLPSWAGSPTPLGEILGHFQNPLVGRPPAPMPQAMPE